MFMPNLGSFFTHPDPWPKNIPVPPVSGSETLITQNALQGHVRGSVEGPE